MASASAARLALLGVLLEATWIAIAALTYPLSHLLVYNLAWGGVLGPLLPAFQTLAQRLQTLVPASVGRDLVHGAAAAAFLAALLIVSAGYLSAVGVAIRARQAPAVTLVVTGFALLYQLTLIVMPGILTTDIASYSVYGHIAGLNGANPYVDPPSAFPGDPLLNWISGQWRSTPSVYGPLWTDMSGLLARATAGLDPIGQIFAYRLIAIFAYVASLPIVYWLLGRLAPTSRLPSFVAYAWSPLILFHVAANGHNDGIAVLLIVAAIAVLARWAPNASEYLGLESSGSSSSSPVPHIAWMLAIALLTLGTLVKWVPAFVLLFCGVAWARTFPNIRQATAWFVAAGVMVVCLAFVAALPWLPGLIEAPISGLGGTYAHSLLDVPSAWLAAHVLDREGLAVAQARATARTLVRIPATLVFVLLVAFEVRRLWQTSTARDRTRTIRAVVAASTRTLLAFLFIVSTQVQPWYFSWPLALGVLLGWRDTTAQVAVAYSVLFPFVEFVRGETGQNPVDPLLVLYVVLPLLLPAGAWLRRRRLVGVGPLRTILIAPGVALVEQGSGLRRYDQEHDHSK